jgi:hypothetical protein
MKEHINIGGEAKARKSRGCIYRRSAGLGRKSAVLYMAGREGKIAYNSR